MKYYHNPSLPALPLYSGKASSAVLSINEPGQMLATDFLASLTRLFYQMLHFLLFHMCPHVFLLELTMYPMDRIRLSHF